MYRSFARSLLVAAIFVGCCLTVDVKAVPLVVFANHTYEVKIRLDGKVSTTQVKASDAGHAKKLVQAQYGPKVTVLGTKRLD